MCDKIYTHYTKEGAILANQVQIFVLEIYDDIDEFLNFLSLTNPEIDKRKIKSVLTKMPLPLSIVFEPYYVDKLYRDTYYIYYSSKHIEYSRNCQRISFFSGDFKLDDFYYSEKFECLSQALIGTMVLRPLSNRTVGRTLIDPTKLNNIDAYIRTTTFSVEILGNIFLINAFPFSSQDSEVMTCAETTVWNLVEYYGTRYSEYRTILPSEMFNKLDDISSERILPSEGLDYFRVANLLKVFSFAPRLYADTVYDKHILKMLFHYYIESGIPLAMGIEGENNGDEVRHSIIGIGHATEQIALDKITINHKETVPIIDSSQLYEKYVIIDDNQIPYTIENFNDLTLYQNSKLCIFAAPLYKRIFLDASNARDIIYECLDSLHIWNFIKEQTPDLSDKNPIIIRIFLTSSRKYKSYRLHHLYPKELRESYARIHFPKFLWVAEISTYDLYQDKKILGEIVIDATSNRHDLSNSIILIKYKSLLGFGQKNQTVEDFLHNIDEYDNIDVPYDLYENNLLEA